MWRIVMYLSHHHFFIFLSSLTTLFCYYFIFLSYFNASIEFSLNSLPQQDDLHQIICGRENGILKLWIDSVTHMTVSILRYLARACLNLKSRSVKGVISVIFYPNFFKIKLLLVCHDTLLFDRFPQPQFFLQDSFYHVEDVLSFKVAP